MDKPGKDTTLNGHQCGVYMSEVDENKANIKSPEDRKEITLHDLISGLKVEPGSIHIHTAGVGGQNLGLGLTATPRIPFVDGVMPDSLGSGIGYSRASISNGRYTLLPGGSDYTTAEGSSMLTKTINGVDRITSNPFSIAVSGLTQAEVDRLATIIERSVSS